MNHNLIKLKTRYLNLRALIRDGAALFVACISLCYILYPHWVTFSHFANRWYTFIPFLIAIGVCSLLLWQTGKALRRQAELRAGGTLLVTSAVCAIFIICVPYAGSSSQKDMHNIIVLLFVLLAASGIAMTAKRLRSLSLATISAAQIGICALELTLLARLNVQPVSEWVWVVLQLILTPLTIAALYIIASELERRKVG